MKEEGGKDVRKLFKNKIDFDQSVSWVRVEDRIKVKKDIRLWIYVVVGWCCSKSQSQTEKLIGFWFFEASLQIFDFKKGF